MKRLYFTASLWGLAVLVAATSASAGVLQNVNCDNGQSIQKALDASGGYGGAVEIVVRGLCEQNVQIARDVVLRGVSDARISGQVTISGMRNVQISDLTITGPGHGLVVDGGYVTLRAVHLTGNEGSAIVAQRNATVRTFQCEISGNLTNGGGGNAVALLASVGWFRQTNVVDNNGWGINAFNRSHINLYNGAVSRNSGPGLHVVDGSQLQLFNAQVADNGATGVVIRLNSNAWIQGVGIHGNQLEGLSVAEVSSARVFGSTISGNIGNGIGTAAHAFMFIDSSNIQDNGGDGLFLYRDAGAEIGGNAQIPANGSGRAIACAGGESSVDIHPGALIGPVDCVHPEF